MPQPLPVAKAQTGNSPFAHLREMRSNLIGYLEHLAHQGDLLRIPLGPVSAALLQLKVNLATILQRYRLTVAPGYHFEPIFRFNTRPKNGLPMVVHSRNGA